MNKISEMDSIPRIESAKTRKLVLEEEGGGDVDIGVGGERIARSMSRRERLWWG